MIGWSAQQNLQVTKSVGSLAAPKRQTEKYLGGYSIPTLGYLTAPQTQSTLDMMSEQVKVSEDGLAG